MTQYFYEMYNSATPKSDWLQWESLYQFKSEDAATNYFKNLVYEFVAERASGVEYTEIYTLVKYTIDDETGDVNLVEKKEVPITVEVERSDYDEHHTLHKAGL